MKIVLIIVLLAAAGGGYFGWQQHQDLARLKGEFATTKTALDKANADANAAKTEAAAAMKAVEDQKAELQQAKLDVEAAAKFLEMEKAHSARLQQELTLAREQIAYISARSSGSSRLPAGMIPMPVQPQIREIRIAPSSIQGRAVSRGMPAQPSGPSEGYARPPQQ
jgi:multidrug efflux pump subunit AcrA (membrane-fusion protein)